MIAAKAFDPVLGVDIHIIQPPGPVPPIPVPHPFIGLLMDPFDFAPIIGATVMVNGLPRATAGTGGRCIPPHIPIGGVFVKPPANECDIFMGSATVLADSEPQSFLGMPALSCHCVGMPPIPRLTKKRRVMSLVLPTSVVLAVPMGAPVLVGGPPTISMMALGMRAGMAVLGKLFKKLRKLQKASRRIKALSDKIQNAAARAMKKLGVPPSVQNKVHRAVCSVTGHPVDVATGKVFTEYVDFALPGPIPFRWERVWYSSSTYDGPLGHGWHHRYDLALVEDDASGVVAVRMADGRPVAFRVLSAGEEAFDRTERLTLSRDGRGYSLKDHEGRQYRFRPPHQAGQPQPLQELQDAAGSVIWFNQDELGRLTGIIDSAGRSLKTRLDDQGRILALFVPDPDEPSRSVKVATYVYDADGNLIEVRDALENVARYAYRDQLLVRETVRDGLTFYFEYDSPGPSARCLRTWGDGGIFDHKLRYDVTAKETRVEDSLGHVTRYYSNPAGLVITNVDPMGGTSRVDYNEHNQVIAEQDAAGGTFSYAYDDRGNLTAVVRPDGSRITIAYDRDRAISAVDTLGGRWAWEYDASGRIVRSEDPLGGTTIRRYEGTMLAEIRHPSGRSVLRTHDRAGNLVHVQSPDGSTTVWTYDALGRPTARISSIGGRQNRSFDLMSRVVQVEEPDGTVRAFEHDPLGRIVRARDPNRDTRLSYTCMGRVAAKEEDGLRVAFNYDTEGQLIAVTNERGLTYRYDLDANGRVSLETGFDGQRRRFTRDILGRVTRLERPGERFTEFDYDALDRIVETRYHDGEKCRYTWRADGELTRAENAAGVVMFERDALGRIVKERQGDRWVESHYDADGNRVRVTSSLGLVQTIQRNEVGDPTSLQIAVHEHDPWEVAFTFAAPGLEAERILPGGLRARRIYDAAGRPTAHEVSRRNERLHSQLVTWATGPRIASIEDDASGATRFGYAIHDVTASAQYPDGSVELRLPDAVGNLFRSETRRDRNYGSAGELLSAEGVTYYYDEEGNLVRRVHPDGQEWRFHWNGAGRLTEVRRPDGGIVRFVYDALGRRTRKTTAIRSIAWVWDGHRPIHEVTIRHERERSDHLTRRQSKSNGVPLRDAARFLVGAPSTGPPQSVAGSGVVTWVFEPHSFAPLAKISDSAGWCSIVTNHLGTPAVMFDDAGRRVWKADLDLNGAVRRQHGDASACPFRFPGQYEDSETGLYYNRFRYYDPAAGSYISQDPTRLRGGLGLYAYVRDVLTALDPFGLQTLYHYTTEEGLEGITSSDTLNPSIGEKNARFGSGQYFTDIPPEQIGGRTVKDLTDADRAAGKMSQGQAAANIYGDARKYRNLDSFVEIDVTGLDVEEPRPGTFVIKGEKPLDIKGRIVRSGKTCGT